MKITAEINFFYDYREVYSDFAFSHSRRKFIIENNTCHLDLIVFTMQST